MSYIGYKRSDSGGMRPGTPAKSQGQAKRKQETHKKRPKMRLPTPGKGRPHTPTSKK
jgi:hypothetical protein